MNEKDILEFTDSFKGKSYDEKLDKIGVLFGLIRKEGETTIDFRNRVVVAVGNGYVEGLIIALDIES